MHMHFIVLQLCYFRYTWNSALSLKNSVLVKLFPVQGSKNCIHIIFIFVPTN